MTKDTVSLTIEPRKVTGKAVKHLRAEGQVPVVIHDHGKDSIIAQAEYMALVKVWKKAGKHSPIELKSGGKNYTALIKDAEFDPRKHQLRHVVFNAVSATQKVEAEVPLRAKYEEGNESSPAERAGFMVLTHADTINVEAIASKLPEVLYYDAEKLVEVGDSVSYADVIVPEGVILKADPSQSIATVYEPSALQAANEAAGGDAEPEAEEGAETEGGEEGEPESKPAGEAEGSEKPDAKAPEKPAE